MKTQNQIPGLSIEKQYFLSTFLLFFFIIILYTIQDTIGYETVSMILLLIIFLLPLFNFSIGPIILSAVISALAWDYYFIPPHFTMHIAKTEDAVMLFMFFIVALTNGMLAARLNSQKNEMLKKERRLKASYTLIKALSVSKSIDEILKGTVTQLVNVFGFETVIFFPENHNQLNRKPHPVSNFIPDELEWLAAEAAFKIKSEGGNTTELVSNAEAFYHPIISGNNEVLCMIGVKISESMKSDKEEMNFLRNFIDELTPFLERYSAYSIP